MARKLRVYRSNDETPMKIVKIEEECITFNDGCKLYSTHKQSCCESHYLDFSNLETLNIGTATGDCKPIYEREFVFKDNQVTFSRVEGMGIKLYDVEGNAFFIPGYGRNNGYYGDNIELVYEDWNYNVLARYDVSECQDYAID